LAKKIHGSVNLFLASAFSWLHVWEHSQLHGAAGAGGAGGVVDGGVVKEPGPELIGKSRSNIVPERGSKAFKKEEISSTSASC
jgi:hypothetical protein